ncbi:MAG: hypothetical protein EOM23_12175 [Candidatus Moranbacteria bacterium]|nr:hypothetical protein [Candidatus Moranbacteria bacterium]
MKKAIIITLAILLTVTLFGYRSFSNDLYRELVRFPEDFIGRDSDFEGEVLQWIQDPDFEAYLINTCDDYDAQNQHRILLLAPKGDRRFAFLEDDYVGIFDVTYMDVYVYQTVRGDEVAIPAFIANAGSSAVIY